MKNIQDRGGSLCRLLPPSTTLSLANGRQFLRKDCVRAALNTLQYISLSSIFSLRQLDIFLALPHDT